MSAYLTLLKALLKMKLSGDKDDRKKRVGTIVGMGFLYLLLGGYLVYFLIENTKHFAAVENGIISLVFMLLVSVVGVIVFVGTMSMLSYVYFGTDAEFLNSLPIKGSTVFMAKLTVVYLYELITALLFLVPSMITIGICARLDAVFYLSIPILILLTPLVPLLIIAVIAIPLMFLSTLFKNRGAVSTVLLIILQISAVAVYVIISFNMQQILQEEADIGWFVRAGDALKNVLYPLSCLATFSVGGSIFGLSLPLSRLVAFLLGLALCVALALIAWLISKAVYQKGVSAQFESAKSKTRQRSYSEGKNPILVYLKREFREITRNNTVAVQVILPIILVPILVVMMRFSFNIEMTEEELAEAGEALRIASRGSSLFMLIFMGVGLNMAAGTAISREGKGMQVLKSLPIDPLDLIKAKIIFSCIVSFATLAIGGILFAVLEKLDILEAIFMLLFLFAYGYAFTCYIIWDDMRIPNLTWTTLNELYKRSTKMLVPLLINLAMCLPIITIIVVMQIFSQGYVGYLVLLPVVIGLAILWHSLLIKKVKQKYYELEV